MPSANELIAHDRTVEEVGDMIGADWLVYQDLEDLVASSTEGSPDITEFDCSVFTGEYITGDVDDGYLSRLDAERNDAIKAQQALFEDDAVLGLHNEEAQ